MIEKTGHLTGVGITLEFEAKTGFGHILNVLSNSAALKSGLQVDDEILSVNGVNYKGKGLPDMAYAIRGPAGETVNLKILRGDKVFDVKVKRDVVTLPEVEAKVVDVNTGLLTLSYFKEGTAGVVEKKLEPLNVKRLIIDLRGNSGGTFTDAVKVGELFVPKGDVIVRTRSRDGKKEEYTSSRSPWHPDVQIIVLTDKDTASGAELLTAALKEQRKALVIGAVTHGKWNAQSVETLPNKFAVKYSVLKFESGSGSSYDGEGLKPDLNIEGPTGAALTELQNRIDLVSRLKQDGPLRAALEVTPTGG